MEDQSKSILNEMAETRCSMTEKLEALENKVADRVRPMTDAVERVGAAAADLAENVKDSVHVMTDKVGETAAAVGSAFNLQKQTERHPWIVFGAALATGCALNTLMGRRPQRDLRQLAGARESHPKHKEGNGKSHHRESGSSSRTNGNSNSKKEGFFTESLEHLKDLAISSLLGVVRDLAKQSIPGAIGSKIAEEVDRMTKSLGAEPIQGAVLGENFGRRQEGRAEDETSAVGTENKGTPPGEDYFRARGGSGFGLR